jgi:hypothetical protein
MSCALAFAADSKVDLAEFDIALQEAVLDELDALCESAVPFPEGTFIRDFTRQEGGVVHYVFLRLSFDLNRNTLLILGISHHVRRPG